MPDRGINGPPFLTGRPGRGSKPHFDPLPDRNAPVVTPEDVRAAFAELVRWIAEPSPTTSPRVARCATCGLFHDDAGGSS